MEKKIFRIFENTFILQKGQFFFRFVIVQEKNCDSTKSIL